MSIEPVVLPQAVDPQAPPAAKADPPTPAGWWVAALVTMVAAIVSVVFWPGETWWMNDEPRLVANAFHANRAHRLADKGLRGNFAVSYGPVATQIYQVLLLVTHDPITLVRLRAGLCAGVTAGGLLWLAWSLRLTPWFALGMVLAPFLWVFQRIPWDASFAIPIGTIALAAYASFLRTGRRGSLLACVACTLTVPLIHPQGLPLAIPLLAHLIWRHRPALHRSRLGLMLVVAALLALNAAYFVNVAGEIAYYVARGFPRSYPGGHSRWLTLLANLRQPGGRNACLDLCSRSRSECLQTLPRHSVVWHTSLTPFLRSSCVASARESDGMSRARPVSSAYPKGSKTRRSSGPARFLSKPRG